MGGTHNHWHDTKITEKRAVTDDSIRILNEMREKTLENIMHTVRVQDNILDGVAVFIKGESATQDVTCCIRLSINGQTFLLQKDFPRYEFDPNQFSRKLRAYSAEEYERMIKETVWEQYSSILMEFVRDEFDKVVDPTETGGFLKNLFR